MVMLPEWSPYNPYSSVTFTSEMQRTCGQVGKDFHEIGQEFHLHFTVRGGGESWKDGLLTKSSPT